MDALEHVVPRIDMRPQGCVAQLPNIGTARSCKWTLTSHQPDGPLTMASPI
ncbi:hypothetical protein JCM19237_3319 [Photobacterium aphoticum]|uniref:Uncharacterized protein n=1 Tax=Photobacterium aphoticum TaxID=754436 RepID=A0A090QW03_9GAMM|nr:hypothetical protein JCM19237_3319 [Photobacterium aphoticum]